MATTAHSRTRQTSIIKSPPVAPGAVSTASNQGVESYSPTIVGCTRMRFPVGWFLKSHRHDAINEMHIILNGTLRVTIEGVTHSAQAGDVLNYPRGTPHEELSAGPQPIDTLFIVWKDGSDIRSTGLPRFAQDRNERMRFLSKWMLELNSGDARNRQTQRELLTLALTELSTANSDAEDPRLQLVHQRLQTRMADPGTLEELARLAGLTPYHLIRLFKARYGQTPMAFLRARRIDSAKVMIRTSDQPLRVIAPMLGFFDEFHLSKAFKAAAGMSPRRYRLAAKKEAGWSDAVSRTP